MGVSILEERGIRSHDAIRRISCVPIFQPYGNWFAGEVHIADADIDIFLSNGVPKQHTLLIHRVFLFNQRQSLVTKAQCGDIILILYCGRRQAIDLEKFYLRNYLIIRAFSKESLIFFKAGVKRRAFNQVNIIIEISLHETVFSVKINKFGVQVINFGGISIPIIVEINQFMQRIIEQGGFFFNIKIRSRVEDWGVSHH